MLAVQFTRTFDAGHWDPGNHGYRLAVTCPELGTEIEPPVVRFNVDPVERLVDERVWLRFDGLSTTSLSPADLTAINPDQPTTAVMTLVGLTQAQAATAVADCAASVVYDGSEPRSLVAGEPFTP
jgi:hypothetical protein